MSDFPRHDGYYDIPSTEGGFRREIGWGSQTGHGKWCWAFPDNLGQLHVRTEAAPSIVLSVPGWLLTAWLASEPVEPLLDWLIENTEHADFLQEFVRRMAEARSKT